MSVAAIVIVIRIMHWNTVNRVLITAVHGLSDQPFWEEYVSPTTMSVAHSYSQNASTNHIFITHIW